MCLVQTHAEDHYERVIDHLLELEDAGLQTISLSFTPVANANGTATITITVQDSGGTNGGGVDTLTRSFSVTVTAVNDAPSFTAGANQSVAAVCQASLRMIKQDAYKKHVSVDLTIDPAVTLLHADVRRLKQILVNLHRQLS